MMSKLSRSSLGGNNDDTTHGRKNMNLYELLDFEGEVSQLISQFETSPDQSPRTQNEDEIRLTLEKATEAFVSYLDGQEKYKSSLSGMYTEIIGMLQFYIIQIFVFVNH